MHYGYYHDECSNLGHADWRRHDYWTGSLEANEGDDMQIGFGAKQHDAYEVSPFYYMGRGHKSLTAGGAHLGDLGVKAGGRFVPVSGPPAPFYWGKQPGLGHYADYWSKGLEGLGDTRADKFTRLHNAVLRRRAKGQDIPRRLRNAYQKQRAITPGAEAPKVPVKLVPHPAISARGPAGFLQWFRSVHPILFARLEREQPQLLVKGTPAMSGLGNDIGEQVDPVLSQKPASSGWTSQMFSFLDKVLANKQEKNMAEVNLELARQGYAPVGFVEQVQVRAEEAVEAVRAAPPAVTLGIPLLIAGGVALWAFMR